MQFENEIKVSSSFIDKLITRLKSGDSRSIHLNALPGNFARLDVFDFRNIQQSLHLDFLNELLTKENFSFKITIDFTKVPKENEDQLKGLNKTAKRLNHLYYQEKEAFEQFGYSSFGFGYPLLIFRDAENPKKIIKAPLFIWYLELKKDTTQSNTWRLHKSDEQAVIFNEVLQSYLEKNYQVKTDDIADLVEEDFFTERKLINCCELLLQRLNGQFDAESAIPTILPCTNKESLELLTKQTPWLRWSGVLGMYKTQKQSIINDLEQLASTEIKSDAVIQKEQKQTEVYPVLSIDASQEEVIRSTITQDKIIIQGPPGTGKSQTLTSIIIQALLQDKKTLMVCEKRTALEVIQHLLQHTGLSQLTMLIDDVYADRNKVIEAVRQITDTEPVAFRFKEHDYKQLAEKIKALRHEINTKIKAPQTELLNNDTFEEIVLELIEKSKDEKLKQQAELLAKTLRNSDYTFDSETYNTLLNLVEQAEQLANQQHKDDPVFNKIRAENFIHKTPEQISKELHELATQLQLLYDTTELDLVNGKKYFDEQQGIYPVLLNIFAVFSSKYRHIRTKKELTRQEYLNAINKIKVYGLCTSDLHDDLIEQRISNMLLPLKNEGHTYSELASSTGILYAYAAFQSLYLKQETTVKYLIDALKLHRVVAWKNTVILWFKNELALRFALQNKLMVTATNELVQLQQAEEQFSLLLTAKIKLGWQNKIQQALAQKDKTQLRYLYNLRKNKQYGSRNTLRKIIHEDADFFTTMFPVVMVNPSVSTSIFPLNDSHFDYVIFDESSQLRLEDTYTSLLRGKQKIISGDRHQMPPSSYFSSEVVFFDEQAESENEVDNFLAESNSLLEYADSSDYINTHLNFHYRSEHPDLIRFSNAAFYDNRLIPMPETHAYQPIILHQVNGIYGEGLNEDEADAITDFVFSDENKLADKSVGIATFNIFQRDLILDKLYEKAAQSKENQDKLNALLQLGLFVKNLENIQGDERDIILISTTFGKDASGKFRQFFGPLSTDKGYQLLNVIITRAKKQLHVFTSFPDEYFTQYETELKQKGNTGKAIVYAFLSYVKWCDKQETEMKARLLETLVTNKNAVQHQNINAAYKNEIEQYLHQHFSDYTIAKNMPFGGFILDFVLKNDEKIVLCIDLENDLSKHAATNYRLKLHKEKMLNKFQIPVFHLWLYDFWKNKDVLENEIKNKIKS